MRNLKGDSIIGGKLNFELQQMDARELKSLKIGFYDKK